MSGGKGGSNQTVAYYYAPIAFAICEGPIVGIKQIWAGGNLIFSDSQPVAVNTYQGGGKKSGPTVSTSYQQFSSTTQNDTQTGGSSLGPWTCYLGTETQPADPTIGEGVAYRGIAYIVFNPLNIGPGATIPPLTFEVVTLGALNPISVIWEADYYSPHTSPAYNSTAQSFWEDGSGNLVAGSAYSPFIRINPGNGQLLQVGNANVTGEVYCTALIEGRYCCWCALSGNNYPNGFGFFDPDTLQITEILQGGLYVSEIQQPSGGDGFIAFPHDTTLYIWTAASLTKVALPNTMMPSTIGASLYLQGSWYGITTTGLIAVNLTSLEQSILLPSSFESIDWIGTDGINIYASVTLPGGTFAIVSIPPDGSTFTVVVQGANLTYGVLVVAFGCIFAFNSNYIYKYSMVGTLLDSFYWPGIPVSAAGAVGGNIWVSSSPNTYLINPGGNTIIAGTVTLPAAVTILCERAGIAQFDVSELPPTPVNFVRGDTVTARSMLQRLSQAYFFSMVDSGGVLKFVPWGQPSLGVIPLEDLGYDKVSPNAQTPFTASRISGVDLPRSVRIRYISAALNWEKYEQVFALESYESGKEITLDLPLILDDQTAYNIAALACCLPHAERMQYSFTTSYKWLALEPGDVVTLPFGTCRILTVKMGQKNGIPVIDFTACIDGINSLAGAGYATPALPNYQPNTGGITALLAAPANLATTQVPGSPSPHPIATAPQMVQTVPNAGVPKMVLVEPPPLSSTDTGMRFLTGAYSTGNVFPGAGIFQSTDGGNTYTQLTTEISATLAGYANTVLPAPTGPYNNNNSYTWDNFSTVDVYLLGNGGDLTPAPDLNVMNGANGAMLGSELIQFANATLMTDSLGNPFYRLSRLLRGRRGTEWAMGTHQVGEPFYAIPSALSKEPYTPPMLNNAYLYKVVMMGGDLGNAPAKSYEPSGASLMQWAPCEALTTVDTSGDWTISWVPRARYNGDFASGYIPYLDPDTTGWSIDILSGTTVVRTIQVPLSTTAPWQTVYTAAMQSADGFSAGQTGIAYNLYQLSQSVGRGAVTSGTTGAAPAEI